MTLLTSSSSDATSWCDVSLAGHTVPCVAYDVSKLPVSVHVPLNRVLSGLFSQTTALDMTPRELFTSLPDTVRMRAHASVTDKRDNIHVS